MIIFHGVFLHIDPKNLVVILAVGPDTQKCVDWLNEELTKKSTLKNVVVKTIEQCRGLEFPALLTISTEGKIGMKLNEAHITGDFFCFTVKKSWALKIAAQNWTALSSSGLDKYILSRTTAFPQYLRNLSDFQSNENSALFCF